jgi:SAM domain (Sterile alpha motif)
VCASPVFFRLASDRRRVRVLDQWSERPDRYGEPSRFETIPSHPMPPGGLPRQGTRADISAKTALRRQTNKWSRTPQSDIFARSIAECVRRCAAVQEIADWLDKLGMSEYAQRFAENRIDFSVLPDLTDQDLEKMGVVLGDRRKILRAIAGLDDAEKAAQKSGASVEATSAVRPRDAAERRQVTVMFSDLVGSTALSARMDRLIHNADAGLLDRHVQSSKMVHAALLLLMFEAV